MDPAFAFLARRLAELDRETGLFAAALREAENILTAGTSPGVRYLLLGGLASGISSIYTGIEGILAPVLAITDEFSQSGQDWHRRLLEAAVTEVPGVRPSIISEVTFETLDALRGVRHFERHNYRGKLDQEMILNNSYLILQAYTAFRKNIGDFVTRVSDAGQDLDGPRGVRP